MVKFIDCVSKMTVAGKKITTPSAKVIEKQMPTLSVPNEVRIANLKAENIKANFLPVKISSKNTAKATSTMINSPEKVSIRSLGDTIIKSGDKDLIYRITRHPQTPQEQMLKEYLEKEYAGQVREIQFMTGPDKFIQKLPNLK